VLRRFTYRVSFRSIPNRSRAWKHTVSRHMPTLAENAGLNPIAIVTELRNRHALGERSAGINVRKVCTAAKIDNSSF
jgi:hypothetical protein